MCWNTVCFYAVWGSHDLQPQNKLRPCGIYNTGLNLGLIGVYLDHVFLHTIGLLHSG